ncbi:MAG: LysR family transcriptional regulator [Pseudomonadales bacterium]
MDKLTAMRTFVEIVDRGSLTAAADALDRSQASVVRGLAALEKHLGVVLLRRTTRRMSLTPEGQDFLERCRAILADVEEAERAVARNQAELSGALRVTAPVEFGRMHLAPLIAEFLLHHHGVRADLLLLDRNVDLVSEGIDLALRIGALADSSLVAIRLGEVRRVTVASPRLLKQSELPDHPDELSRLPCVRQQNLPGLETTWLFSDGRKDISIPVDGRFGVNQIAAATAACVSGMGFGQFLSYQVRDLIAAGELLTILEEYQPEPWPVSLVYHGGRMVPSRLRALIDWLKDGLIERRAFG